MWSIFLGQNLGPYERARREDNSDFYIQSAYYKPDRTYVQHAECINPRHYVCLHPLPKLPIFKTVLVLLPPFRRLFQRNFPVSPAAAAGHRAEAALEAELVVLPKLQEDAHPAVAGVGVVAGSVLTALHLQVE